MICWELFLAFLEVGAFTFGGGYGAVPLIRDVVLRHGWMTEEGLAGMIAVSESTPGPIMVNMATYVGSSQAGILGALAATFAVVLPSFVIIVLVAVLMRGAVKNGWVQAALRGLKACIVSIILVTGGWMTAGRCMGDWKAAAIAVILGAILFGYPRMSQKRLSPIALIGISAVAGILFYGI